MKTICEFFDDSLLLQKILYFSTFALGGLMILFMFSVIIYYIFLK